MSLKVINELHNVHFITYKHLKEVQLKLSSLSDTPWASARLEVLGRMVVVVDGKTGRKSEPVSGQQVFAIPLRIVISGIRQDVRTLNKPKDAEIGQVVRGKFVAQNLPVIAGTRIPVSAIKGFARAGYDPVRICKPFPDLRAADIEAAIAFKGDDIGA